MRVAGHLVGKTHVAYFIFAHKRAEIEGRNQVFSEKPGFLLSHPAKS